MLLRDGNKGNHLSLTSSEWCVVMATVGAGFLPAFSSNSAKSTHTSTRYTVGVRVRIQMKPRPKQTSVW